DSGYAGEGGGSYGGTLNNCTIIGNSANGYSYSYSYFCATGFGGGGRWCTFYSYSPGHGGGANRCILNNCTLAGNLAGDGGGSYNCTLNNCIVQSASGGSQNHCWTADPLFVDANSGNFRLRSDSPCIDAGDNSYAFGSTDLDGRPRIIGGTV